VVDGWIAEPMISGVMSSFTIRNARRDQSRDRHRVTLKDFNTEIPKSAEV